jgi:hypothetical protein
MRDELDLRSTTIKILPRKKAGKNPKRVFQKALDLKYNPSPKYEDQKIDHIFCVFDHDDRNEVKQVLKDAKEENLNVAISDPCFELWLILHFNLHTSHIPYGKDRALKVLQAHFPEYKKNMKGLYSKIKNRQNKAIENAGALRKKHQSDRKSERTNPSTNVDELVSLLLEQQ